MMGGVFYHSACGHFDSWGLSKTVEPQSNVASCERYPEVYLLRDGLCGDCRNERSQPLVGADLQQKITEVRFQNAEGKRFLAGMKERNEPLEVSLYSLLPNLVDLFAARQIHVFLYQLTQGLRLVDDEVQELREARLTNAVLNIPMSVVREFTFNERLTNMEILLDKFCNDVQFPLDWKDVGGKPQEPMKTTVNIYKEAIEAQMQLQSEMSGNNSINEPDLEDRWKEIKQEFSRHKQIWQQMLESTFDYDADEHFNFGHYDENDEWVLAKRPSSNISR
jgi:hypothetical protein